MQENRFEKHPIFLNLKNPALEEEFKRFHYTETRALLRIAFHFGGITLAGDTILTYFLVPQYVRATLYLFSFFLPFYFLGLYVAGKGEYTGYDQWIASISIFVIATLLMLWTPLISDKYSAVYILLQEFGCLFACFYVGRLRFVFAVMSSFVCMGVYQGYLLVAVTDRGHFFVLSYAAWLLEAIACYGGFIQEGMSRTVFTQQKIISQQRENLNREYQRSENLLHNILPHSIAERLKDEQTVIADHFDSITVLFADIVDFTVLSERLSPTELVNLLNRIFSIFDDLAGQYRLEKIKTIGDAYMVAGGIPDPQSNHLEAIADFALEMQQRLAQFNLEYDEDFEIRVGMHTGPAVAGVIGVKKFVYDIWGDTVNTASRMESNGIVGEIQVSENTYIPLRDKYIFKERGLVDIKGKGKMRTYLLQGKNT
ncbi:MAG: adenylate cyclase [Candidatus Electrothrix sp. Rat3]|nr:adenylate cyclase [Candidatus Electrothrix rattekaaiensis]